MKSILAILLSVGLMTNAEAENSWDFVAGDTPDTDGTRLSFFYDPTTLISPDENTRQVVILAEYLAGMQSAMTFGESEVSVVTFDCQIEKMLKERTEWYEFTQAQGDLTKTFERSVWQPIYSSSLKLIRTLVCSL